MILIIASSNNYNYLNQIRAINSVDQLRYDYDYASSLATACESAFELGQSSLYVCNVQSYSDYFEIVQQIKALEVDYIVTPELRFDKQYALKDGRKLPIYLILSELLPTKNFIVTDYHAREFTDMSHFLKRYNVIRHKLSQMALYPDKIALVANNLKSSENASVNVACAVLQAAIAHYPTLSVGESYYDLENEDFLSPIVYFKNGMAQNLFNLSTGLESNLVVQHMLKVLKKEMDNLLDYLTGTRFRKNTLFTVRYKVEDHLELRKGQYYDKYRIVDIIIKNQSVEVIVDVQPFLSSCSIRTQVVIQGA